MNEEQISIREKVLETLEKMVKAEEAVMEIMAIIN